MGATPRPFIDRALKGRLSRKDSMTKSTKPLKAVAFSQEDDVIEALEGLMDVALIKHFDPKADETFIECKVCGGWEEHADDCPMPLILRIMDSAIPFPPK